VSVSTSPIGYAAISETYSGFDAAVASPIDVVRNDKSIPRTYIAEIRKTGYKWTRKFTSSGAGYKKYDVAAGRDGLWLVCGASGRTYRTEDHGDSWEEVAVASGGPSLYDIVQKDGVFVAGHNNGIVRSEDNGDTWVDVNAGTNSAEIYDLATGNGVFLGSWYKSIVSTVIQYSSTGEVWADATIPASTAYTEIVYDAYSSSFWGVGWKKVGGITKAAIGVSQTGLVWTSATVSTGAAMDSSSLARISTNGKGLLVIDSTQGTAWASTPAKGSSIVDFTYVASAARPYAYQILWHPLSEEFYGFATGGLYESSDGAVWDYVTTSGDTSFYNKFAIDSNTGVTIATGGNQSAVARMQPSPIRVATDRYVGNGFVYEARLDNPANFSMQLGVSPIIGGESRASYGVVSILNGDGRYDDRLNDAWDNGVLYVKFGTTDIEHDTFGVVYEGFVQEAVWDEDRIQLSMKNNQSIFEALIQDEVYGSSYSSSVQNKPLPIGMGVVLNAAPVVVSAVLSATVYQVNDGPISSIDHVYFAGVSTASYTADISTGTFTLTVDPSPDEVTVDFKGEASTGYSGQITDLITNIVTFRTDLTTADLDLPTIQEVAARNAAVGGIYITADTTIRSVLDTLLLSIGGYWGVNRSNQFFIGTVKEPGTPFRSYEQGDILAIKRLTTDPVVWSVHAAYEKIWTVQSGNTLAGAVTDARRAYLSEEHRHAKAESSTVAASHTLAREIHLDTLLAYGSAAESLASSVFDLYSVQKNIYSVVVGELTHDLEVGQSISITYPRFGLDNGKSFALVGFTENIRLGSVSMLLWG